MEFPTLENVDIVLASKVEKLAKAYNWLTGKDNFSLARLLNGAKVPFCGISAGILEIVSMAEVARYILLLGLACGIFFGLVVFFNFRIFKKIINDAESEKEMERIRGLRSLEKIEKSRVNRHLSYIGVLVPIILSYVLGIALLAFVVRDLFNIVILHLIDLDEPPYKKSRLLEKIREAVTIPKLSPVPTH